MNDETRQFPIQSQRGAKPHPLSIPWHVAELAYSVYSALYGRGQSLERLAQRGGFGPCEMDNFLPDWRERCDAFKEMKEERDKLLAFKTWVHSWLDANGVPADPDPEKTASTGCRIGGRMEWLKVRGPSNE